MSKRPLPLITSLFGVIASMVLVARAYDRAEVAADGQYGHFALFWLAMTVGVAVPAYLVAKRGATRLDRIVALVGVAVVTTWPKALRTLGGPAYSDEFGHLFSVDAVLRDGPFSFRKNPLLLLANDYPVLHWIVAGLHKLGLDTWTAAQLVAVGAHLATLLLIAGLVRTVTGSGRAGAIAGVLYAVQPGWMYFSAQFAYETLALPLLVGGLWAALAARSRDGVARIRLLALAAALGVVTVLTHHLAGIAHVLLLASLTVFERRGAVRRGDRVVLAAVAAVAAVWTVTRIQGIIDYYGPAMTEPVSVGTDAASDRALFGGAEIPGYEKVAGLAFPFILLVATVFSVWSAGVRAFVTRGPKAVLAVLGSLFFLSLPALFQATTSESAHRSWGYSFVGLVLVWGVGLSSGRAVERIRWSGRVKAGVAFAVAAVAAVGGVAAGSNAAARFPGPLEVGNDSRSVSVEAGELADYMYENYGAYTPVLADRYTAQQLAGFGSQRTLRPSVAFPIWNLLFLEPVEANVDALRFAAGGLALEGARFVVVDTRMDEVRPTLGYWFTRTEPGAKGDDLVPTAALAKFECDAYSTEVVAFGPLTLYEIDTEAMIADPLACAGERAQ